MLVHLVSFKYRTDAEQAARAQHRQRLAALHTLDGVIDLKVGEDVVRSPRAYDTGLIIRFAGRAALDEYQRHPRHVPVAQLGAWTEDEAAWPENRDLKTFREWFRIDIHSVVVDVADDDIEGEEL